MAVKHLAPFITLVPPPDLQPPLYGPAYDAFINGWSINAFAVSIEQAWSKSGSHGSGWLPNTLGYGSRNSKALYSTKELAAAALRIAVKERFDREYEQALKRIDSYLKEK